MSKRARASSPLVVSPSLAVCGVPVDDADVDTPPPARAPRIAVPDVDGADPVETEVSTTTRTTYRHRPPTSAAGTQTDDVQHVGPPSMTGRSHIEVTVTAHLLEALFGTEGATLEALWAALRRGDALARSDAAFELNLET